MTVVLRGELILHLLQFVRVDEFALDARDLLIPCLLEFAWFVLALHFCGETERACILASFLRRLRRTRVLATFDQSLVEATGPTIEDRTQHIKRVTILVSERNSVVTNFNGRLALALRDHALFRELCNFKRDDRRHSCALLKSSEVSLDGRTRFTRIEVADDHAAEIVGAVVGVPVLERFFHRVTVEIARPTNHWPRVSTRHPEHRVELLLEHASGCALRAKSTFFMHDIALRIELAKDRVL